MDRTNEALPPSTNTACEFIISRPLQLLSNTQLEALDFPNTSETEWFSVRGALVGEVIREETPCEY